MTRRELLTSPTKLGALVLVTELLSLLAIKTAVRRFIEDTKEARRG